MINSVLNGSLSLNSISGYLVDIKIQDSSRTSQGAVGNYILTIDKSEGQRTNVITAVINYNVLSKYLNSVGISGEIAFRLLSDKLSLTEAQRNNLAELGLKVTGELTTGPNLPQAGNTVKLSSLNAVNTVETSKARQEADPRYQKPVDADWPDRESYLPFIPVPVRHPGIEAGTHTRVGYAIFKNPISYVQHHRTSHIEQIPVMRQSGTLKKGTGKAFESYTISYIAQGAEEIMTSVQEVFEQISLTPFTTADGGPFGSPGVEGDIPHKALAVRNFSVSTVEGLPNALQVEISFDPFQWQYYIQQSDNELAPINEFDDAICWPLVKLWGKTRARSQYTGNRFDGRLGLYFPDPYASKEIEEILYEESISSNSEDLAALDSFKKKLLTGKNNTVQDLSSRNLKEVQDTKAERTFFLKVGDLKLFNMLMAQADANFLGLINWQLVSASNYYDDLGKFAPTSAHVNPEDLTAVLASANPWSGRDQTGEGVKITDNDYLSVPRDSRGLDSLRNRIKIYILSINGFSSEPASGTEDYNRVMPIVHSAMDNPQNYFALVLRTTGANKDRLVKTIEAQLYRLNQQNFYSYNDKNSKVKKVLFEGLQGNDGPEDSIKKQYLEVGPGAADEDIVIERIGGSRGHNLAVFSQRGDPLPLHQYMGGMDATFIISGKCFGSAAKKKLERLKAEFDNRAINVKSGKLSIDINNPNKSNEANSTFLFVDNEIFRLLGVNFVMPVTAQFETIDQQPGVWNFSITFIEFNPSLKKSEEIKFLPTSWSNTGRYYTYGWNFNNSKHNPIYDRAVEYFNIQGELAREEVYPDLALPTQGEFRYWISTLKKGATLFLNSRSAEGLRAKNSKGILLPQQKYILDFVSDQFFPNFANRIAQYFIVSSSIDLVGEPGSYVQPDFYAWYHPDESFHNLFDDISENLMGAGPQKDDKGNPKGGVSSLKASGRPSSVDDPNKSPIGSYREYDPNYKGVSTVYSHEFWAANAERYTLENEFRTARDKYTYPKDAAKEAIKLVTEKETALDNDENAWWSKLLSKHSLSVYREKDEVLQTSKSKEERMYEVYDFSEGINTSIDPVSLENLNIQNIFPTQGDLERYFTVKWKQEFLKRVASYLNSFNLTADQYSLYGNNKYYLNNPEILLGELRPVDLSIADIEKHILSTLQYAAYRTPKPSSQREIEVNSFLAVFDTDLPWILRSAFLNGNFRRVQSLSIPTSKFTTGRDGMLESWDYIDNLCSTDIDPNIIRSIFIRRDNFGQFNPIASLDTGFGDLDIQTKDPSKGIPLVIATYKKYSKQLNGIPSLTLLAVNMELTRQGRNDWFDVEHNKIRADVFADMQAGADAIVKARFTKGSAEIIREKLNKYASAGNTITQYFATYISLCRVYGSYIHNRTDAISDMFFHPLNALILEDTNTNEQMQSTNFTPNGDTVSYSMSRKDVDLFDPYVKKYSNENYDPNAGSIDMAAAMAKKMRASLDPHSETALYGSLVDFRTNAPFGKLRGAFPSFQILLINEGFYWNGGSKKLWDQFYTRTGVASIEVHRSREMPGSSASITFSNMFHNLTAYALLEAMNHQLAIKAHEKVGALFTSPIYTPGRVFGAIGDIWDAFVVKSIPEDVRKIWMNNQIKRLALSAGTRLQIRMGYGSNAASLPIVFIGNVVDAPVSDGYVTITAVSDGHELEKPATTNLVKAGPSYAFQDSGAWGMGSDPSLIVKHAMIAANTWDNLTGGNFRDHSNGIAHFGEMYFNGGYRYSAELEINLYAARKTSIEQGITEITQWNFVNGIVNWNNERNLFSVSVQEPTPWKVMEVCRRACADFVAAAEPFALRSTAFFGKWWWPYHYTYSTSILNLALQERKLIENPNRSSDTNQSPDGSKALDEKPNLNTPILNGLPKKILDKAKTWYRGASIGYAIKLPNDIWRVVYQDGAEDLYDEVTAQPKPAFHIPASPASLAAYRKYIIENLPKNEQSKYDAYLRNLDDPSNLGSNQSASTAASRYRMESINGQDLLIDVQNLQMHLKWKPYMQAYIAHSAINLLDNNIRADSSKVFTDAIGLHQTNGVLSGESVAKTIAYSIDTDIHPSDRKTLMVDTGIYLTGLQAGIPGIAGELASLPGRVPFLNMLVGWATDPVANFITESPTTAAIENGVVGALIDTAKDMYQGWFTIQGMASVKPRDMFLLTDHLLDMKGPVFVKDVIHRMDAQTGFITLVSPDAVVLPHDSVIGQQMICSLCTGFLHRIGSFFMMKAAAVGLFTWIKNRFLNKNVDNNISSDFRAYQKVRKHSAEALNKSKAELTKAIIEDYEWKIGKATIDANKVTGKEREFLLDKAKRLNESRESFISKSASIDNITSLINEANALGVDVSPYVKDLDSMASLSLKMDAFELTIQQDVAELRSQRGKGLLSKANLSDEEFEEALTRFANHRRAQFVSLNNSSFTDALKLVNGDAHFGTAKQAQLLEAISKRNELSTILADGKGDAKVQQELIQVRKEVDKLTKELQVAADSFDILERELDMSLRGIIKFEPLIYAEGARVGALKAMFQSVVDTPATLFRGGERALISLLDDVSAAKRAAKEILARGSEGSWTLPTGITNAHTKLKDIEKTIASAVESGALTEAAAAEKVAKARRVLGKRQLRSILKGLKKSLDGSIAGIRLLKYMGPQAIVSLAVDTIIMIVGQSIIEGINARFRARQCVKIIPLRVGGIPYTAGIKGHQGAVIGDDPSWVDNLFSGLTGASDKVLPSGVVNVFGFFAALNGVETPNYGITEADSIYLQTLQNEERQKAAKE